MSNAVRRGELYPLAEGERVPSGWDPKLTRARWTGEHRPARKGEWFLSGAIVEAYAVTDGEAALGFHRHIAELVRGRVVFDA